MKKEKKKVFLKGRGEYEIPVMHNVEGNEKLVVVIVHEFRSAKYTPTTKVVMKALEEVGIASCCFDFPGHDESPVEGDYYVMENCINDLSDVENYMKSLAPDAEIAYFASSFGAYTTLCYFVSRQPLGHRAFLRCAATNMKGIIDRSAGAEGVAQMKADGYTIIDKGPMRPLKMMYQLYEDFCRYDLFELCKKGMGDFIMMHGDQDKMAPHAEAKAFSEKFDIPFITIEGTDHFMFKPPYALEEVAKEAVKFFTKEQ